MKLFDQIGTLFCEDEVQEDTITENAGTGENAVVVNTDENSADAKTGEDTPTQTGERSTGTEPVGQPTGTGQDATPSDAAPTNLFGELTEKEGCGCAAPGKKKPAGAGGKKGADKKKESDSNKSGSKAKSKVEKPKEPENDLERLVVITAQNERRTYPPEMTLEQIRADIEKDFPAFSKENSNWHFEKQEDNRRYLCIPTYKFSKAG